MDIYGIAVDIVAVVAKHSRSSLCYIPEATSKSKRTPSRIVIGSTLLAETVKLLVFVLRRVGGKSSREFRLASAVSRGEIYQNAERERFVVISIVVDDLVLQRLHSRTDAER